MAFTNGSVEGTLESSSSLRCHIFHVVAVSSQEKVVRIHTAWLIAAVQNSGPIRDRSAFQLPGHTMRDIRTSVRLELPVRQPGGKNAGRPHPATV